MTPTAYTLHEAKKLTGLGHTKIYQEINAGRLRAKKCGRKTLISADAISDWLENLADYPAKRKGGQP